MIVIPRRALRRIARISGWAAALLALFLVADGLVERKRASRERAVVDHFEELVPRNAEVAPTLAAEREVQTLRSVERRTRNRRLGWGLLLAASLFLAATKRLQALTDRPLATFGGGDRLVQLGGGARLAPSAGAASRGPAQPPVDLQYVDEVLAREGTGPEAAVPILQALQSHYRYLPKPALERVCERTQITPADLVGVASFYSQFRAKPVGKHLVKICHGTACHVAGIGPITDELRRRLAIPDAQDSDPQMRFTLDPVNCLGCCSLAPVLMVDDHVAGRLTPTSACEVLAETESRTEDVA